MTPTAHRFENLLSIDVLTKWERSTLTDIYDFYKIKKRLSKGQRNLVWKIENQAQVRVDNPPTVDEGMIARIDKVAPAFSNDRFLGGFLTSVKDQLKTGKTLSDRQLQILANAEDDYNKNIKFEGEFSTSEDMQERFSIAIDYYRSNSDFRSGYSIAQRVDNTEGYKVTFRDYHQVAENKYAKRVIEATRSPVKYSVGSTVTLAASAFNGSNYALKMRRDLVEQGADLSSKNLEGLVLDAGSKPVISAVKGAKRYTILFFGASRPFIIEERYLKRGKKR
tara:strand:- start:760 stop:1596 length:837 start_codon:yes stop_codon:yes gene_type:complete